VKLFSSNTEVINNIEQVNIIFTWRGRNIYVQRYSQFKSGLVVVKIVFQWRQGLIFIHNIMELLKDEHESLEKPLNNSWNNPKHSQSFSKIPMSCSYS
jgi:hypothetical protein